MNSTENNNDQTLKAKLEILRVQMPFLVLAALIVSLVTVYVMWGVYSPTIVGTWLAAVCTVAFGRFTLAEALKNHNLALQKNVHTIGAAAAGIVWAAGVFLFATPEHPELLAFVIAYCLGVTAGSLPALSPILSAYVAFAIPCMGGLALRLITLDFPYTTELCILALGFLAINLSFSRNLQKSTTRLITLDLKNARLLTEVNQAKEDAEQANIAKSKFLAAASHDLRQPLHAMGLFLEAFERKLKDNDSKILFGHIQKSYDALEALFITLLEISKLDAGRVKPAVTHFALKPVLTDLVKQAEAESSLKNITCTLKSDSLTAHTDSILLQRILRNFLTNAINYTNQGSIIVSTQLQDGDIRITVTDTGIGIPEDEQENIFSEYHQLNNIERDRNKGLGLGLAVVRRMANLLNHPIDLTSQPEKGSSFSISIPLGDVSQIQQEASANLWSNDLKNIQALVVDDEKSILEGMSIVLRDWGCQVTTAESRDEAIEKIQNNNLDIDIIITDYRLRKGETGILIIEDVIKHLNKKIPALLISGDTDPKLLESIHKQNYRMLHKPIKTPHLYKVMTELLKQ